MALAAGIPWLPAVRALGPRKNLRIFWPTPGNRVAIITYLP
jgi:hypothetical protein